MDMTRDTGEERERVRVRVKEVLSSIPYESMEVKEGRWVLVEGWVETTGATNTEDVTHELARPRGITMSPSETMFLTLRGRAVGVGGGRYE